jgi:hypothetical protein
MTDDVLAELREDWIRQQADIAAIGEKALRWRRRAYLLIAMDISAALVALGAGIAFGVIAWRTHDWLFGLAAVTLLFACPPCAMSLIKVRRSTFNWDDKTPEGTLQYALRRTFAEDKILKIQFWNGMVLLCFVAVVWICVWAGLILRRPSLILMSGVWVAAGIAALLWARWGTVGNAREKERCHRLLAKFKDAAHLDSS